MQNDTVGLGLNLLSNLTNIAKNTTNIDENYINTFSRVIDFFYKTYIETLESLAKYEAQLSDYAMYLVTFLSKTKSKVNDPNYPEYTYPDLSTLKDEHSITSIKYNIKLLLEYIKKTKPIAKKVYNQYSKLKM